MKKKKLGFTLLEMIIVISLTTVVLGIISTIFITGNKVFSDSDVKSTLQMEGQAIQENVSSIGMQSIAIDSITDINKKNLAEDSGGNTKELVELSYENLKSELTDNDGAKDVDESKNEWLLISEMIMNSYIEKSDGTITEGNLISVIEYKKDDDGKFIRSLDGNYTLLVDGKELSKNVKSIGIKPIHIDDSNGTLKDADSLLIRIVLSQKKGYSHVEYPISLEVKFRNSLIKKYS